jgi:hypothetical protein
MLPGFSFRETMRGSYWLLAEPTDERGIDVALRARVDDLPRFVRDKTCRLEGTVDAERFASGASLLGTLVFKWIDERRMPYRFWFLGDDGRRYELSGQKEWSGLAPLRSITMLPASLYDESGEELARATLRVDLRADWAAWLKSIRIYFPR